VYIKENYMGNIRDLLESYQEERLQQVFGASYKWNSRVDVTAPWKCPKCSSNHGFRRRGSRNKIVHYNNEKVDVRLFQVTCLQCSSTFSPFPEILGLERNQRIYGDIFDFTNLFPGMGI
jgi:hypothetical protein